MRMKKLVASLTFGGLALAAALGLAIYTTASAQTTTPETPSVPGAAQVEQTFHAGHGLKGGYSDTDLAAALGITTDALTTARQTAYKAALDEAVQQGLITQVQADELIARGNAFPLGERAQEWLSQKGIDFHAHVANALGITVEALDAARATAYNARIDAAVTAGTLTEEQADLLKGEYALYNSAKYQSAMQSAFQAAVAQAVSDGVITQAQADAILANSANGRWAGPGGRGHGFGGEFGGRRGGHGGRMGGGRGTWFGGDGTTPSVPSEQPSVTPSTGA